LLDSDLMKQENLLFDNMEDPSQYVHDNLNELNTILGELNTGSVWRNSVKMCWIKKKINGLYVLIPIILFIDATHIDALSR
jgi:hypothetical protein